MSLYVIVCHWMQLCSLSLIYFQGGRVPLIINHGQIGRWVVNYWQPSPDSIGSNLCKMDQMCCPAPPGQHIPPLSVHGGSRPPDMNQISFGRFSPPTFTLHTLTRCIILRIYITIIHRNSSIIHCSSKTNKCLSRVAR